MKHILTYEKVPFIFQKIFSFPDRWYVVDFFLGNQLVLECSHTRAYHYEVALRHKAMYLETKTAYIKRHYDYPIWIFLESVRPIGERFNRTLARLMPSVDQILTSEAMLREHLQGFMKETRISCYSNKAILLSPSLHSRLEALESAVKENVFHNPPTQNFGSYIWSEKRDDRKSLTFFPGITKTVPSRLSVNYSHNMKKEFSERTEVSLP